MTPIELRRLRRRPRWGLPPSSKCTTSANSTSRWKRELEIIGVNNRNLRTLAVDRDGIGNNRRSHSLGCHRRQRERPALGLRTSRAFARTAITHFSSANVS